MCSVGSLVTSVHGGTREKTRRQMSNLNQMRRLVEK